MTELLYNAGQHIAGAILFVSATMNGIVGSPKPVVIVPPPATAPQTAIVNNVVPTVPSAPIAPATPSVAVTTTVVTATTTAVTAAPVVTPIAATTTMIIYGKLPKVKLSAAKLKLIAAAAARAAKAASTTVIVSPTTSSAAPSPAPVATPVVSPTPTPTPKPAATSTVPTITGAISADIILQNTTVAYTEKINGPYRATFTTNLGTAGTFTWGLDQTSIGGTGSVPKFGLSYTCDPPAEAPPVDSLDQTPSFDVRTNYTCNISLTPTSGTDLRAITKQFALQVPPGQLLVLPAANMSTVLAEDSNNGGFTFDNQDSQPITVIGLTFDASFSALSTTTTPLVIRFVDPTTGASMLDNHLESLTADPSNPYTYEEAGVQTQISFTIPANTKKLMPIEALGVHKTLITNATASVKVTIDSVNVAPGDIKTIINSPTFTWSCIISDSGYDPNATNTPYATGQACRY